MINTKRAQVKDALKYRRLSTPKVQCLWIYVSKCTPKYYKNKSVVHPFFWERFLRKIIFLILYLSENPRISVVS